MIDADDNAVCPDFEAAVEACRAAGRGAELDAALREPVPLEHCVWLNADQKAQIAAQEARGPEQPPVWVEEDEDEGEDAEAALEPESASLAEPKPSLRLGEADLPWAHLLAPSRGLSTPLRFIGAP